MSLSVREWGSGGGRTLLFWHALGPVASAATFGEGATVLAARGFRVLAPDGPGFGESPLSPPEQYDVRELARSLVAVADARDVDRYVLAGHSWGGAVALHAAALAPARVEAVVLFDSGHIDYRGETLRAPTEALRWPSLAAFEAELRSEVERFTPELLAGYLAGTRREGEELVGVPPEATAAAYSGLVRASVPETWPVVAARAIPVLLLLATKPPHVDQNRRQLPAFQAAVPHAEVRWVPDAGHDLLADAGPALAAEIADWLERV
ncbi:MAG TPA: alpha/beta hydrolase [Gaiellaceae bacterium]